MSFEPDNLLITGGAGFIGANFVHHWLARPGQGRVLVLDALTYAGNLESSGVASSATPAIASSRATSATRAWSRR